MKTAIMWGLSVIGALFLAAPPLAAQTAPRIEIRTHAGVNKPVATSRLKSTSASTTPNRLIHEKAWGTDVTSITSGFALHFFNEAGNPITLDWLKVNEFSFTVFGITPEKTDVLAYYFEQPLAYFYQETATKGGFFTTKTRSDTTPNSPEKTTPFKNLKINEVGGLYFNGFGSTLAAPAPNKHFSNQLKAGYGYRFEFALKLVVAYQGVQSSVTLTGGQLNTQFLVTDTGPRLVAMMPHTQSQPQKRDTETEGSTQGEPDPDSPVIQFEYPQIGYYSLQTSTDLQRWEKVEQNPRTFRFVSDRIGEWKLDGLEPSPQRFYRLIQEIEPYDPPAP